MQGFILEINGKETSFYQSFKQCHLKRWEYIISLNEKGQPIGEHSIPYGTLQDVSNGALPSFKTSGNRYKFKKAAA